jgi:hypothetical protein
MKKGKQAWADWVRVKDRLPKVNKPVLACTNKGRMRITWVDRTTKKLDDFEISDKERFTHWTTLPTSPKNKK